jgi:hypothetical protein
LRLEQQIRTSKSVARMTASTHGIGRIAARHPTPARFITVSAANDAIQLELFYDYTSKVALYDEGHRYFRAKPPPMLIVWGQNDPFSL